MLRLNLTSRTVFSPSNPKVETLIEQAEWAPFHLPIENERIDFVDGLHTLGGSGAPNLREGMLSTCL